VSESCRSLCLDDGLEVSVWRESEFDAGVFDDRTIRSSTAIGIDFRKRETAGCVNSLLPKLSGGGSRIRETD
jgi:hypothetical protein